MNLNDQVRVRLTLAGARAYNDWERDLTGKKVCSPKMAGEVLVMPLWEVMNIFGQHCFNGAVSMMFEDNRLELVEKSILDIIKPALDLGVTVETSTVDGVQTVDLNTQAKSGCILKQEGDVIRAYRRYDRVDVVKDFDDVLRLVHNCAHGRSFFNPAWLRVFDKYCMTNPCGTLRP